ncbi:DUF2155 domain-containing protein [Geomonas nitrogeniifigens]|uniref:DUF2155 domain-containing protein n=1 Tax=Geomonas diazotrophica TaxID=2843197 RepID=A0ABX8JK04_9BACT|nr:DUF2155 domain-containing protein [Geomonas nitrogeniifigens]QWV97451.1 DUF2155 domain-containing protein [Geomonas nitrogeniifigens]
MKRLMKLTVLSLIAIGFAAGCNEKEKSEQTATAPQVAEAPSTVVVPDQVKGKWKAVQIRVADKNAHLKKVYTLKIGSDFNLPGSDLTLKVETFLPHFVMEGTTLTSQSNDLVNPAAQLVIREKGKEIYKGWLFSLYPTTHAFQHPQYGFTLVDYLPAS